VRTAIGKAPRGALRAVRPDDLAAYAINGALERVPQLDRLEIEDVILGCAMPEAEQGLNVARVASFRAGLPVECSAMTINRFCSSGLQSIAMAVDRIRGGGAEAGWPQAILAGRRGVDVVRAHGRQQAVGEPRGWWRITRGRTCRWD
jgi:acetyl-CoA acetyltransferase